jgi:N-acetylmuramic acid 6-phosphate etherase
MNNADEFLKTKTLFQLGDLPTETPHPKTVDLSDWANSNLPKALETLREIDLTALNKILNSKAELAPIFDAVAETLEKGDRIFLVGCGATGRLSLSLEYLWRRRHPGSDQVMSLMAGGDVALVHSLEGFEDFPEYGARHLMQLGFKATDLLIGSTEGGETPYVIGAVEKAAEFSSRQPLFLYCNTTQILKNKVERSRRVLTNPRIQSFCLETGPMALTGSTRMQASTVLMLVIGLALEYGRDIDKAFRELDTWIQKYAKVDVGPLEAFIKREADTYRENGYTIYSTDEYAITVFTDTTERAPTFNLAPFDNPKHLTERHSLTYITIPSTASSPEAWNHLLARAPRPLHWPEVHAKTSQEYLLSFDFSRASVLFRKQLVPGAEHHVFSVENSGGKIVWKFRELSQAFPLSGSISLFDHLMVKMMLNMHSTLVMGRMGRFEGNLMTWVYPSNGKLVDRAARYTQILLRRSGQGEFNYDDIVRAQFQAKADLSPKESIVHKTMKILSA